MMLQIRDKSLKITFNFATENAKPQIDAAARRVFFVFPSCCTVHSEAEIETTKDQKPSAPPVSQPLGQSWACGVRRAASRLK